MFLSWFGFLSDIQSIPVEIVGDKLKHVEHSNRQWQLAIANVFHFPSARATSRELSSNTAIVASSSLRFLSLI
jgi:hypothetical protein